MALAIAGAVAACPAQALADEADQTQTQDTDSPAVTTTESTNTSTTDSSTSTDTAQGQSTATATSDETTTQSEEDTSSEETTTTDGATASGAQPAAQAGAAQSSDESTYEEANLYQVRVDYVGPNGEKVAPSYVAAYEEGQTFSVASPSIDGYVLADDSQATVSGTASGSTHDITYTVSYKSNVASYTVVYEMQTEGDYSIQRTETREGIVGSVASVQPEAIEGYDCVTTGSALTTVISADGTSTITLRYNLRDKGYGIYYVTNGSYIPAQTGKEGDAVVVPANPTRAGYDFAGWDIDGNNTIDSLPATIQDHDITATAVWTPRDDTVYQVRYWVERPRNNKGTYNLSQTVERTGTTESVAEYDLLDNSKGTTYQYYYFDHADTPTINGDGSTVVDVYYNLKKVTVEEYLTDSGSRTANQDELIRSYEVTIGDKIVFDEDAATAKMHETHPDYYFLRCYVGTSGVYSNKSLNATGYLCLVQDDGSVVLRLGGWWTTRSVWYFYWRISILSATGWPAECRRGTSRKATMLVV